MPNTWLEIAYFGMGCFWQPQYYFSKLEGVTSTAVGYGGGLTFAPSYQQVCAQSLQKPRHNDHIELVRLSFNPEALPFTVLLDHFFQNHNPSEKNRQGYDIGRQYHSSIFYTTDEQRKLAEIVVQKLSRVTTIATDIRPFTNFFLAESFHQHYVQKHL